MPPENSTETPVVNAQRISFPLQLVISLVTTAVTVVLTIQGSTAAMRSDVRDIKTRMEFSESLYKEQLAGLKAQLDEQKRALAMLQVTFSDFQLDFYRDRVPARREGPQR